MVNGPSDFGTEMQDDQHITARSLSSHLKLESSVIQSCWLPDQ